MTHAIGPMLYTDEEGHPAAVEVSEILTVVRVLDREKRPARSWIRTRNGLPIGAMEEAPVLFRRWVEVLSFSVPREPANFPGYREPEPEIAK